MIRRICLVLVLAALSASCGTGEDVSQDLPASISSTSPTVGSDTTTSPTSPTESTPSLAFDDAVVGEDVIGFVAAIDQLLAETDYAGAAIADPDVFVATGWLLCDQLDKGISAPQVLTGYVETMAGTNIDAATDDTLVLAGTLLGTSVGYLCPEHTAEVEQRL